MFKKFLACLFTLIIFTSGSFAAESEFWTSHITDTSLVANTGDFSTSSFSEVQITINASENVGDGSITFPDGGFTLIDEDDNFIETVPKGSSKTLTLKWKDSGGEYKPADSNGTIVKFVGGANENLAGQKVTWSFPEGSTLTGGTVNFPAFKSTASQMSESGVIPNIELIISGNNVTGLKYWLAKASDPSTHITTSSRTDFRLGYKTKVSGSKIVKSDWQNEKQSGEYTFETPLALSELNYILVRIRTYEDANNPCIYTWKFFPEESAWASFWAGHYSEANLTNGASDFTKAKFEEVLNNVDLKMEFKTGTMTITGGGYSILGDEEESVPAGESRTFTLQKDSGTEFIPVTDEGNRVKFNEQISNKAVSWVINDTFYGAAKFPNFRTTESQLSEAVPYIELITDGDNITGLKYRVVKANNTSTEIKPSYRIDFKFGYSLNDASEVKSEWLKDTTSGTYTFSEPFAASDITYIRARLRTHENNLPAIYIWRFYPEYPEPDTISGGSSGSCNSGLSIIGLALIAFIAVKFKTL